MLVTFPHFLTVDTKIANNKVRQVGLRSTTQSGEIVTIANGRTRRPVFRAEQGGEETLILPKGKAIPDEYARVLQSKVPTGGGDQDLSYAQWRKHPLLRTRNPEVVPEGELTRVLASWRGAFSYIKDDPTAQVVGLRPPQIGAVHAVHAHWAVSSSAATIVMPTGTGKTETMISILVSAGCSKVLVVVPTDILRGQLAEKFLTLGVLRTPGSSLLASGALYPIVCTLQHIPKTVTEVDAVFGASHVIVTTGAIAGQCSAEVQDRIAHHCPYLFIDEAHHTEAPTWSAFKERFSDRHILQFTATPFREDGRPLDGDIVFNYPLRQAQRDGYFKPIRFRPVVEFNTARSDAAIARKAIEQLREDQGKGHILMARVDSVSRARDVFKRNRPAKCIWLTAA